MLKLLLTTAIVGLTGALLGAIVGGSAGILIAAKLDARRAENELASSDPEAARRSASLLSRRDRQSRAFLHQAPSYINPLKKLDEVASDAEKSSEREATGSQR